jgi:mannan endo-1,4-beta-mannosidase
MKLIVLFLTIMPLLLFLEVKLSALGFTRTESTKLLIDGKEYRAIGVNQPDLFTSYAAPELLGTHVNVEQANELKQKMIDAILDAEKNQIAFFRFWATGFWPRDMQLYFDKPDVYWEKMDEVINLCKKHNIKLIPSIFWHLDMWHMLCEEDRQAILNPDSKTYKAMYKYAKEIVSRYKDDTNILMWELMNEGFLGADVQMEGRDAPPKGVYLPTNKIYKEKWKKEDSLSAPMLRQFYIEMTAYIKSIDSNHLVTSGDAGVRETSQSLREKFPDQAWITDSLRQNMSNQLNAQPEPLDVFSFHQYVSFKEPNKIGNLTYLDYYRCVIRTAHASLTPVFIGELGQIDPSFKDDPDAKWTRSAIDMMDEEGVALICLWAWHFPHQPENDLRSSTHPSLMKRVAEFNSKYSDLKY